MSRRQSFPVVYQVMLFCVVLFLFGLVPALTDPATIPEQTEIQGE